MRHRIGRRFCDWIFQPPADLAVWFWFNHHGVRTQYRGQATRPRY